MTNEMTFLQTVAGYAAAEEGNGSADRPIKLAVIDPAYDSSQFPAVLPKVTFEGESTLSVKFYAVSSPYWPQPSDKVWMVPIGSTYLIVGSRDSAAPRLYPGTPGFSDDTNDLTGLSNTAYSAGTPTAGISFVAPGSGRAMILLFVQMAILANSGNSRHAFSTLRIGTGSTQGSGTAISANGRVTPSDADAMRVSSIGSVTTIQGSGTSFYFLSGLTPGASYNAQEQHRMSSASAGFTYQIHQRNIQYVPLG